MTRQRKNGRNGNGNGRNGKPRNHVLRAAAVCRRTGLSRATLYRYVKAGSFPRPIPLGPRAVGWIEAEVEKWIECMMRKRKRLSVLLLAASSSAWSAADWLRGVLELAA